MRKVLVTGSTGAIGEACAKQFHDAGYFVYLHYRSQESKAKELNKKGYPRGAGAIAGVVLEKHLFQVCDNHNVKITNKKPTMSDYNDKLKEAEIYEIPMWRKIQHLGDLRNLCDHDKKKEPKTEDINELIKEVEKITKTLF